MKKLLFVLCFCLCGMTAYSQIRTFAIEELNNYFSTVGFGYARKFYTDVVHNYNFNPPMKVTFDKPKGDNLFSLYLGIDDDYFGGHFTFGFSSMSESEFINPASHVKNYKTFATEFIEAGVGLYGRFPFKFGGGYVLAPFAGLEYRFPRFLAAVWPMAGLQFEFKKGKTHVYDRHFGSHDRENGVYLKLFYQTRLGDDTLFVNDEFESITRHHITLIFGFIYQGYSKIGEANIDTSTGKVVSSVFY